MGAFAKIVCASLSGGGMTPKYNTRRAFVFFATSFSPSGVKEDGKDWVQFDSDYSGGDGAHILLYIFYFYFFPLR